MPARATPAAAVSRASQFAVWLAALHREQVALVRAILDARHDRCSSRCRGWFVDPERLVVVRCDECAILNGYQRTFRDDDVAQLPEARRAQRRAFLRAERAGELW